MMLGKNALPRAAVGEPIYAEDWNKLVTAIELLLVARGGEDYVSNASGVFPARKDKDSRRFRLDAALVGGSDDGALATAIVFNGTSWVDSGVQKTIYGTFISGTLPADTKVQCLVAGGRLEVIGGSGATVTWGTADSSVGFYDTLNVSVYSGPPNNGPLAATEIDGGTNVECIALSPTINGCRGSIYEIPSFAEALDPTPLTRVFMPFVNMYLGTAAEDWTAGTAFDVTVGNGQGPVDQTVQAIAPEYDGTGMSGALVLIVPRAGSGTDWTAIMLGCSGSGGSGS